MKIRVEKLNEPEEQKLKKLYQKHVNTYWGGQFFIFLCSVVFPLIPGRRDRDWFVINEAYKYEALGLLIVASGTWIYYFYKSKWDLRKDLKSKTKDILEYEVLKKERYFAEKSFFIFIDDYRKEEVSEEIYEQLSVGDKVVYSELSYSKERMSGLVKKQ